MNSIGGMKELPIRARIHWSIPETTQLIEFLTEKKNAMDMRNNLFKMNVFTEATIKVRPYHEKGPPKDANLCKAKWTHVCVSFMCVLPVF
jgi:hypothetical protein